MFKPTRILVPTDMSPHADKAIQQAIDIAHQFNSELFFLHIIQYPIQHCVGDYCIDEELVERLQTEMSEGARAAINKQVGKFPALKERTFTADVRAGVAHDEILKEVDERGIDLIVISSLGSTGLAKYLIGSVARHVLLGAKCSVLLVR